MAYYIAINNTTNIVTNVYNTSMYNYILPTNAIEITEAEWKQISVSTGGAFQYVANTLSAVPYVAPVLSLSQLAQQAMFNGLSIISNTDTSLNGVYDVSATSQNHIQAEVVSILLSGGTTFADGSNAVTWADISNTNHTFDVPHFQSFATVVGAYVSSLYKCLNGTLTTLPSGSANIL